MALPLEVLGDEEAYEAASWYRARNERTSAAFVKALRLAFERIQESPETWPSYHEGTRRTPVFRLPYEVMYRLLADRILIVAIAHCKRKPGYWRKR